METGYIIPDHFTQTDTVIIIIPGIVTMVITHTLIAMHIITGEVTVTGETGLCLHKHRKTGILIVVIHTITGGVPYRQILPPGPDMRTGMQKKAPG